VVVVSENQQNSSGEQETHEKNSTRLFARMYTRFFIRKEAMFNVATAATDKNDSKAAAAAKNTISVHFYAMK
jgi:predicted ATPase